MDLKKTIAKYDYWMEFGKMKFKTPIWIAITLILTFTVSIGILILTLLLNIQATMLPFALGLATFVLLLGYPYMRADRIINNIEKNFSDALKLMADTLKAGDTYENALREVVNADYGRLSEEINIALRRLEEGENMKTALTAFSSRIDSRLIKRTITIIIDSLKTGSNLADVLEDISEDVRDLQKLKEERKSNTTMQFLFMLIAGGIIAPAIFGEVNSIMAVFGKTSIGIMSEVQILETQKTTNFVLMLIQAYLIIEVVASGIMMSIIREGKLNKSIIYIPILLVIAFVAYYAAIMFTKTLIGGVV